MSYFDSARPHAQTIRKASDTLRGTLPTPYLEAVDQAEASTESAATTGATTGDLKAAVLKPVRP